MIANAAMKLAEDLVAGDVILGPGDVRVTVLRDKALDVERVGPIAGQPCIRYWCQRADTEAEGWMTYGPYGVAVMAPAGEQATCTVLACTECAAAAGQSCEPWCIADQAVPAG